MKLYTKTGDKGQTGLFGGERVSKANPRVEAYGTVDELNSTLGWCIGEAQRCDSNMIVAVLTKVQSRLFEIGADLATPRPTDEHGKQIRDDPKSAKSKADSMVPRITAEQVAELERHLDLNMEKLPAMTSFILPGGTELACRLHIARTVCRRAERLVVFLDSQEPIGVHVIEYLNRLSDLLFAFAREANHDAGVEDIPWISPRKAP